MTHNLSLILELFVVFGSDTVAYHGSVARGGRHMWRLIRSGIGRGASSPEGEQGTRHHREQPKRPHRPPRAFLNNKLRRRVPEAFPVGTKGHPKHSTPEEKPKYFAAFDISMRSVCTSCARAGVTTATRKARGQVATQTGSQRTTTTNEPLPLVPVRKRVGMSHFVKSPLAYSVTRL